MDQEYYNTINATDYIKVILKEKRLIFSFFLMGLIISTGLFFLIPNTYNGVTLIEVGTYLEPTSTRTIQMMLESPLQITEKIENGFYGRYSQIKTFNLKNTNLVRIEIIAKNPNDAKKDLAELNAKILSDHENKLNLQKSRLEEKQNILNKTIASLEENISLLILKNQQISSLRLKIYDIQLEIENLRNQITDFKSSRVIVEPSASQEKSNTILILITGGCLGLLLGIFLAFSKTWWRKNKYKIES